LRETAAFAGRYRAKVDCTSTGNCHSCVSIDNRLTGKTLERSGW
jgi:hypothetical protein